MTVENQIKELEARLEQVKKWPARVAKLPLKKTKPLSESQFCEKYGFDKASFNRNKHSGETGKHFPTKRTYERIMKALKKEGV